MTEEQTPRIGVAMIARNAAELMPYALDPIVKAGIVEEIAIVLGGISSDETPELAEKYATLPVEPFKGKVDEGGRLMNFAEARNQSFDILRRAGVKYALVVDTDDQWDGLDKIPTVVEHMERSGTPMALFPYHYEGGTFLQPRIYRMDSGYWRSPCHNYWEWNEGVKAVGVQINNVSIRQVRDAGRGKERRDQNIRIGLEWMEEHGDECRLLLHVAKDAMVDRQFDVAHDALTRYFVAYETDTRQDPEELYNAHHTMSGLLIMREKYVEALTHSLLALSVRPHGQSWALASEAAAWLGRTSREERPLLQLSKFCATQAYETGNARGNLHWHADVMTNEMPLLFKARALIGLGRFREGRGYLDLALRINPKNKDAQALQHDIAQRLGEM